VVDRRGVPLAAGLTAANRPDDGLLAALVDAVPPVRRPRGRPRQRPAKLHADKGYDYRHCRDALRRRGITARIARKGVEGHATLGRHRWVAERTLAWLARYRRLTLRYERLEALQQALLDLGCALICHNFLAQLRL
jgi:transposase